MRFLQDVKWVDVAIKATVLMLLLAVGYLAYTVVAGQSQARQGSPTSRAIQNLIAAIEENPDNVGLRISLAEAYAADGQLRAAIEQFNVVLELRPDHPDALTGLGLIAMFQGEWELAEDYWRTVIDEVGGGQFSGLDQRLAVAYHQLGVTLLERKQYEESAQYFHEALRIRRSASDTHYLLSVAYREMGSVSNQRTFLENTLLFDPTMAEANYDYGLLLLAEGDVAAAAEHFRMSLDHAPSGITDPADELAKLGEFSEHMDEARRLADSDPEAALIEARIARALDSGDIEAAKLVATLYERQGDVEKAVDAWHAVLDVAPNDTEADSAIERLNQKD